MHTSAGIFLVTDDNKVLILHPSGWYNKNAKWSIPKGNVEDLESPSISAFRELEEETGIRVSGSWLDLGSQVYKSRNKRIIGFAMKISKELPVTLDWENDQYKWASFEECKELLHEAQVILFERIPK